MRDKPVAYSPIVPRLLRIQDAARYLSCTNTFIETLIREKTVPSFILGKRRLIDVVDLDAFVDRKKTEQAR
jgi:excisionase family DNA binding protein